MFKRLESHVATIVGLSGIAFTLAYSAYVDANTLAFLVA